MFAKAASACALGQAIYYLRAQYHGIAIVPWEQLAPSTKQRYVESAQRVLEDFAPNPRVIRNGSFELAAQLGKRHVEAIAASFDADGSAA